MVFYDLKILRPVIKGHLFALFRLINQTSSYGNTPLFSFEKQHLQRVDGTASSPHCLLTTVKWGFAFASLCCNNPLVSMPTFPKRQATSFCCLPLLAMQVSKGVWAVARSRNKVVRLAGQVCPCLSVLPLCADTTQKSRGEVILLRVLAQACATFHGI